MTLAARFTSASVTIDRPVTAQITVKDAVVTTCVGLSYGLNKALSVYTFYGNTFTPQSSIPVAGGTFKPLYGINYEAGIKKDWMQGKWNTTLSLFQITRDNVIVSDPITNIQSQIGQMVSKGIEFDLKGEIVKGLNAVINYAYLDSYISKDVNESYMGKPTPYRIKHNQNTWLNYQLPGKTLAGFRFSGGYQWQVGRAGRYYQDVISPLANVFRLDAGLGWTNTRYGINLLVNNLTNRFN